MVIKSSKSEEQEGYRGPGAPIEDLAPKIIWASSGNDIISFLRHKIHYGSVSTQILDNASEASNFEIRQYQEARKLEISLRCKSWTFHFLKSDVY